MIVEITDSNEKQAIAREILEALTDWFGVEESREEYISGSAGWTFFAAKGTEGPIGFLCLKETRTKDLSERWINIEWLYPETGWQW